MSFPFPLLIKRAHRTSFIRNYIKQTSNSVVDLGDKGFVSVCKPAMKTKQLGGIYQRNSKLKKLTCSFFHWILPLHLGAFLHAVFAPNSNSLTSSSYVSVSSISFKTACTRSLCSAESSL